MVIELVTSSAKAPLEVLDLQVALRPSAGQAKLSLRFLYRDSTNARYVPMPTLSWFDASRLQKFTQELTTFTAAGQCRTDLSEAGMRLIGSVQRRTGRQSTDRQIQVEPLPQSAHQFTPFVIRASQHDVSLYAQKLYSRLWEVFTRA